MKLTTATLLTLLLPFTTADSTAIKNADYANALACAAKPWGAHVNTAISQFCNRRGPRGHLLDNIVVPSPYATNGVTVVKAHVSIRGTCSPAQWVPREYCAPQFHAMCAAGEGSRFFGWGNQCQQFIITHG